MMLLVILVVVVVVIVPVAVAFVLLGDAVQDYAQDVGVAGLQAFLGFLHFFGTDQAGADHQHHAVGQVAHQGGIRHGQYGRQVDEYVVVVLGGLIQQVVELFTADELGRVGRHGPAGQQIQVGEHIGVQHLGQGDALGQAVGDSLVDDAEDLVLHGLPQVAVHQQHLLAVLGHGEGQVGNGGALPFSGHAGREADELQGVPGLGELQVRADGPIGFRQRRFGVIGYDQLYFFHNFLRNPASKPCSSSFLPEADLASGITPKTGSSRYCSTSAAVRIFRFSRVRAMV